MTDRSLPTDKQAAVLLGFLPGRTPDPALLSGPTLWHSVRVRGWVSWSSPPKLTELGKDDLARYLLRDWTP